MTPESPQPGPVTGRTQWDAFSELIHRLGNALPWLLLLAGLVYLAYTLREQKQDEVSQAHKELRETYGQMADMTRNQITNIQSLDALQQNIHKNMNAQYVALRDLESKAAEEKRKAEELKLSADQIRKDMAELDQKSKEKGMVLADFEKREQELQNRVKGLDQEYQTKSSARAQEIEVLRRQLQELTDGILGDRAAKETALGKKAQEVREKHFAEVETWLREFAAAPEVRSKGLDRMIGLSEEKITGAIGSIPEFALWAKASPGPGSVRLWGAVKETADGYERLLSLRFNNGRLTDISVAGEVVAVQVSDSQDWSRKATYILSDDAAADRLDAPASAWTLASLLRIDQPAATIAALKGDPNRTIPALTPKQLEERHPRLYRIPADRAANLAESLRMTREAEGFDAAAALKSPAADRWSPEVRKTFVDALNAAVRLDEPRFREAVSLDPGAPMIGRVAALALRPAFRVERVYLSEVAESVQAKVPDGSGPTVASALASYQPSFSDRTRRANFFFSRTPAKGWVLSSVDEWADAAKK